MNEKEFMEATCVQCDGSGEIPKIGFDEDGFAIQDLWKICNHCEDGVVCALCEEKPTICKMNDQCYE